MLLDRIVAQDADLPASMCISPQMARIAVVLPAPSGPISPNISPRLTLNDTPLKASTLPYRLTTLLNSMAVGIFG